MILLFPIYIVASPADLLCWHCCGAKALHAIVVNEAGLFERLQGLIHLFICPWDVPIIKKASIKNTYISLTMISCVDALSYQTNCCVLTWWPRWSGFPVAPPASEGSSCNRSFPPLDSSGTCWDEPTSLLWSWNDKHPQQWSEAAHRLRLV